ncbi:TetR/AcrR family transcriptional regulator [Paenibacillus sp. SGZ-1009]|uniref:TetR/AcrR family transcriptional regulator n=1 Tax=Paenibacillus campi TaxID=3106031 RepID=UPI002AFFEFA6|nr:TetR/AcrR family transcriptional regulator C-terminal domain-containing protein [Paenibacillus sp. SGZ-1009]
MKKQQPQISEEKILEASWELLGTDGIEKLSMRRLAERLGIQAPSLYWHFKSKQHLYQGLASQVSKTIVEQCSGNGDWKDRLSELAITMRQVLNRYPCSAQIMMMTMPSDPDIIRFMNYMLGCVEDTPLEAEQKMQVVTTLLNYVLFFVMDHYQHMRAVEAIPEQQHSTLEQELLHTMDTMRVEDSFLFRRMFTDQLFELMGSDQSFAFGLRVVLLGIEQVVAEQGQQQ